MLDDIHIHVDDLFLSVRPRKINCRLHLVSSRTPVGTRYQKSLKLSRLRGQMHLCIMNLFQRAFKLLNILIS